MYQSSIGPKYRVSACPAPSRPSRRVQPISEFFRSFKPSPMDPRGNHYAGHNRPGNRNAHQWQHNEAQAQAQHWGAAQHMAPQRRCAARCNGSPPGSVGYQLTASTASALSARRARLAATDSGCAFGTMGAGIPAASLQWRVPVDAGRSRPAGRDVLFHANRARITRPPSTRRYAWRPHHKAVPLQHGAQHTNHPRLFGSHTC